MLLSGFSFRGDTPTDIDSIHNFYEALVLEELQKALTGQDLDNERIADISCVALNSLPTRYIRHDVDMMFYLSTEERREMHNKVSVAVSDAIAFVKKRSAER